MREILFRGKRCDNGEWVDGFLLKECNYATCSWNLAIEYKTDRFGKFAYDVAEVVTETVGQYTGLTDKDGKKIFEGDILEWAALDGLGWGPAIVGYVDFDEKELAWRVNWQRYDPDWLAELHIPAVSIVGNIHDNPELLENH